MVQSIDTWLNRQAGKGKIGFVIKHHAMETYEGVEVLRKISNL
jgi:hypothetical protein